jgi:hypothetical protein
MHPIPKTFAHSFSHFDLKGIAALLDDTIRYDGGNISKLAYLQAMENCFEALRARNVHELKVVENVCKGCNKGLAGFVFVDEESNEYYSFVLDVEDNQLKDLVECSRFSCGLNLDGYKQVLINTNFEVDDELPF